MKNAKNKLPPVHPGEVLREEFLKPLGLSVAAVAKGLGVSPGTVYPLLRVQRGVSAELAMRLARYVGTTAEFWVGLQGQYDLDIAQDAAEQRVIREVRRCPLLPVPA